MTELGQTIVPFSKGLHELGNGHFAYLLPTGTWGFSNAGLVRDGDQALLVDTLFDEPLTLEMLSAIRKATELRGEDIQTVVNTHANGDHTFGNHLLTNAQIIASAASAQEMAHHAETPEMLATMLRMADKMGIAGEYAQKAFGPFDFSRAGRRLPDQTFAGEHQILVGDKKVFLIEVGPAHTAGDTLVYVPEDRVVYTGDILFIENTPVMWRGPVRNWLAACDRILNMDVDVIVPGHGPVTDKKGVRAVRSYFEYVESETKKRYQAGMSAWEAAQDIALGEFAHWADSERIVTTVSAIYRDLNADLSLPNVPVLFGQMAELRHLRRT